MCKLIALSITEPSVFSRWWKTRLFDNNYYFLNPNIHTSKNASEHIVDISLNAAFCIFEIHYSAIQANTLQVYQFGKKEHRLQWAYFFAPKSMISIIPMLSSVTTTIFYSLSAGPSVFLIKMAISGERYYIRHNNHCRWWWHYSCRT